MPIDYKKELISAAKTMILVHEPEVLIKMIVRMIVHKVRVRHAGILLHDRDRDTYILTVSKGAQGLRIPPGFARMDGDNPLISYFRNHSDKQRLNEHAFIYEKEKRRLSGNKLDGPQKKLLKAALYQLEIFEVIVCIPSYFRDDLVGMLLLGAKKNGREFEEAELDFFVALASDVAMAIRNAQLFKQLEFELDNKQKLFINTTIALAAAIDAKDHYTRGHTSRVTEISLEIAKMLSIEKKKSFDVKFFEQLHIASLLHDIGKIGIPEAILNKEGSLSDEEWRRMKEHPVVGASILEPIKELEEAILGVKYHHERYDGTGYPDGLKGDQIPLIAAIIAAADTFDAMSSDRPYRLALPKQKVIEEIKKQNGKQLNPEIVDILAKLYESDKI